MNDSKTGEKSAIVSTKQKKDTVTPIQIADEKDQMYYCNLCSHSYEHSELIDGSKCPQCKSEFFLIVWSTNKKKTPSIPLNVVVTKEQVLPLPTKTKKPKSKSHRFSSFFKVLSKKRKKKTHAHSAKSLSSSKKETRKKQSVVKSSHDRVSVRCPQCNSLCFTKLRKNNLVLECPHCNFIGTVT